MKTRPFADPDDRFSYEDWMNEMATTDLNECVVCGAPDTPPIDRGDGSYDEPVCDECWNEHYGVSPNTQ